MSEFYRNGSGYVDPTAYRALTQASREPGGAKITPGSIWSADMNGKQRCFLLVAVHKDHANTLILNEEERGADNVAITTCCGATYYVSPNMMAFRFYEDLSAKEDEVTPGDFRALQEILAESLGLARTEPAPVEKTDGKHLAELQEAENKITRLTAERDLYRAEFRELQARLIEGL